MNAIRIIILILVEVKCGALGRAAAILSASQSSVLQYIANERTNKRRGQQWEIWGSNLGFLIKQKIQVCLKQTIPNVEKTIHVVFRIVLESPKSFEP